jgi:uncharacterized membrane protein
MALFSLLMKSELNAKEMKNRLLLYKVIMWRLISIILTLTTLYLISGDIRSACGITMVLEIFLTTGHFAFEKAWEHTQRHVNTSKQDQ